MAEQKKAQGRKADGKKAAKTDAQGRLVVATNRRARFEYEILDTLEAGIQLVGPEVKSLRAGRANLGDAFAQVHRGELWPRSSTSRPTNRPPERTPPTRNADASCCSTATKSLASRAGLPKRGSRSFR